MVCLWLVSTPGPSPVGAISNAENTLGTTSRCLGDLGALLPRTKSRNCVIVRSFCSFLREMEGGEKTTLLQDEETSTSSSQGNEENACSSFMQCKVYKRRWYVLFIFTLTSIVSNLMWNTWGPIQRPCRLVFGWERWTILLLSSLGAIGPILGAVPSTWLMDMKGELTSA